MKQQSKCILGLHYSWILSESRWKRWIKAMVILRNGHWPEPEICLLFVVTLTKIFEWLKRTTSHSLRWSSWAFSRHSGLQKKITFMKKVSLSKLTFRRFDHQRPAEGEFADRAEAAEVCGLETSQAQWLCSLRFSQIFLWIFCQIFWGISIFLCTSEIRIKWLSL